MASDTEKQIKETLAACSRIGGMSAEALLPVVYHELRKLAASRMSREAPGITLQPTALVHEAYLRLVGDSVEWDGAGHFFAAAAESMRRILVDHARARSSLRRGGNRARVDVDLPDTGEHSLAPGLEAEQILAVDTALSRIDERDPRMANVVRLRFFAGLGIEETARAMGVSNRTVRRDWTFAKAFLTRELGQREQPESIDGCQMDAPETDL